MTQGVKSGIGYGFPETLLAPVRAISGYRRLWVALSGGLDSTLLLHLTALCHPGVRAVHINHQLQVNAGETVSFCQNLCDELRVPLTVMPVTVRLTSGPAAGLEEAARKARYSVFEALLEPGDVLLMAHHGDDQAETVVFRMLRGSGVAGLAGMPERRPLGAGHLARPLLGIELSVLEESAQRAGLSWVDDPSNADQKYDRNFLRQAVLPMLKQRWPGLNRRLQYSARACSESDFLNKRLAELQWRAMGGERRRLSIPGLAELSLTEQKNLLHWWVRRAGFSPPSVGDWSQVLKDLLLAAEDRSPELRADGYSLRRFQGQLHLVPKVDEPPEEPVNLETGHSVTWGGWTLRLERRSTAKASEPPIRICTRQGGERVRLQAGAQSRSLKKWLQEQAVPPWERARLPLVYAGEGQAGELIAVGDLWCSEQYCGEAPAAGLQLIVERDCD